MADAKDQPKNKRQHFVPKLLLRNFSKDEASVNLLVLETGKSVTGASLKTQCYEDYYYGKDGTVEGGFGKLEGSAASVIKKLLSDPQTPLSGTEEFDLRLFIHYQHLRTPGAAAQMEAGVEATIKAILAKDPKVAEVGTDGLRISLKNAQFVALRSAIGSTPQLMDLSLKVLIPKNGSKFILSDHPVVMCNQWIENHPKFSGKGGATGLAIKGLQVFLPISPTACLALHDADAYEYGGERGRVCNIGARDVDKLNKMQIYNAEECAYSIEEQLQAWKINEYVQLKKAYEIEAKPKVIEGKVKARPDGTLSQIINVVKHTPKIGRLTFVKCIDSGRYTHIKKTPLPVRSYDLMKIAESYRKIIDEKIAEAEADLIGRQ